MITLPSALAAVAVPALALAPAMASAPAGSGAGIGVQPACSSAPLHPGRSYRLDAGGLSPGVQVTNPGTGSEDISLSVRPVPASLPLHGKGYPVPPSWVSFGYPRLLGLVGQHAVRVGASGSATVPVTVSLPAGARAGTYVALLTASTGASPSAGRASLGAAAGTYMIFTVGIPRPPWPPSLLAATGNCWAPPGTYESWQQWTGTPSGPPPGWHWDGAATARAWVYTPPPGWSYSWADPRNPGQVYRGGQPARPCADAASYPDSQTGTWIGIAQYPDTSTPAGCSAWLAASARGTLGAEPVTGAPARHGAPAGRTATALAAASVRPVRGYVAAAVLAVLCAAAVSALLWRRRGRR